MSPKLFPLKVNGSSQLPWTSEFKFNPPENIKQHYSHPNDASDKNLIKIDQLALAMESRTYDGSVLSYEPTL